ncbi:hypothetical protein Peur_049274 [Populus x canadensis]
MELDHLGGNYGGNRKPTPFMCLVTKVLQIQPEKDIVVEFIKYVRVLVAFYLRLTGTDIDVYRYLEPLYNDYRNLRQKLTDGTVIVRWTLEALGALETTKCVLEDDFEKEEEREVNEQLDGLDNGADERDYCHERSPARERDRDRRCDSHRYSHVGSCCLNNQTSSIICTVVKCYIYITMAFKAIAGLKQLPIAKSYDPARDRDYDRERGHGRERNRDRDRDCYRLKDERDYGREREREREREGRERERRDRDRGRQRRSPSRSPIRSRDCKRHAHSSSPKRRRDGAEEPKKKREKKEKKDDGTDHPDPEIAEANKLRAALGLKPS